MLRETQAIPRKHASQAKVGHSPSGRGPTDKGGAKRGHGPGPATRASARGPGGQRRPGHAGRWAGNWIEFHVRGAIFRKFEDLMTTIQTTSEAAGTQVPMAGGKQPHGSQSRRGGAAPQTGKPAADRRDRHSPGGRGKRGLRVHVVFF